MGKLVVMQIEKGNSGKHEDNVEEPHRHDAMSMGSFDIVFVFRTVYIFNMLKEDKGSDQNDVEKLNSGQ